MPTGQQSRTARRPARDTKPRQQAPAAAPRDPGSVIQRFWSKADPAARRTAGDIAPRRKSTPNAVCRAMVCGILPLAVCVIGIPYYVLPLAERPWSPFHSWLRPSGIVGQAAGLLAFAMFLSLWLYPLRKKYRKASYLGALPTWLDVHIVIGLVVPLIAAIHSAWRFDGLIGLGYGSMMVVVISGIIGRYLYVKIPRKRGLEMTKSEAEEERTEMLRGIVRSTGLTAVEVVELLRSVPRSGEDVGLGRTILRMIQDDTARRKAVRRLIAECRDRPQGPAPDGALLKRVARMARREMTIEQQMHMWEGTRRVFRLWHHAHKPFAIVAFVAVAIHVVVSVVFGNPWIG